MTDAKPVRACILSSAAALLMGVLVLGTGYGAGPGDREFRDDPSAARIARCICHHESHRQRR